MNSPAMKMLDFRLHDFTRISWVSDLARNVWQPRIVEVMACWEQLELLSVTSGLRSCALKIIPPESLPEFSERISRHGLSMATLGKIGAANSYAALQTVATDGEPFNYRVVAGTAAGVEEFRSAWTDDRQTEVGRLLGYPACCSSFFEEVWCKQELVDTTWPMTVNTTSKTSTGERSFVVGGPPQANILLRWLGLRAVFHLPCRFDCEKTIATADKLLALGREASYAREIKCLMEALSWPVEWSALHGIAEIKTPVLKIAALTDATAEKHVVRRRGDTYPTEGARGLTFTYSKPVKLRLSESKGFERGIRNRIQVVSIERLAEVQKPEWHCTDNGFASESDMYLAQKPLLNLAVSTLAGSSGPVLDLGCGNGALLRRIRLSSQGVIPFGVDIDPAKLAHARKLLPEFAANFFSCDMFEAGDLWSVERRYAIVILMLGRLREVAPERAAKLKSRLKEYAPNLIVYSYDMVGAGGEDLRLLAQEVGVQLLTPAKNNYVALARIA